MNPVHVSILRAEAVRLLEAREGRRILDGTLGAGGHAEAFLEAGAQVLGLDQDPQILDLARERLEKRFAGRIQFREGNFRDAPEHLRAVGWTNADGIFLDLGVSSLQLDRPERGFSFREDGPLDMRMGAAGLTAETIVNTWSEGDLARAVFELGEDRFSRRIARAIVERRSKEPITRTLQLAEIVKSAIPAAKQERRIHPATRTFQALRLVVNDELGALDRFLERLPDLLASGGRAGIISFHSLEDRRVKERFRSLAEAPKDPVTGAPTEEARFRLVARKPIVPGEAEIAENPRARSAKLRVIEKL